MSLGLALLEGPAGWSSETVTRTVSSEFSGGLTPSSSITSSVTSVSPKGKDGRGSRALVIVKDNVVGRPLVSDVRPGTRPPYHRASPRLRLRRRERPNLLRRRR